MPARTTRQAARDRVLKTMLDALDRIIPADESKPLRGTTFLNWEDQADAFKRAVIPTLLEERAALEDNARVEAGAAGPCPHCGAAADAVYLKKEASRPEVLTPDGPAVVDKQHARCRRCGRSFSPAEP